VAETGGQRVSDTIEFLPIKYNMPKTSSDNRITAAINELSSAIKHPQRRTPFLNGDTTNNILQELTDIFQTDIASPRVPVKLVTPHGAPRVPTTTVASHGSPRVHIRKLFVPHNLGQTSYKPFGNIK